MCGARTIYGSLQMSEQQAVIDNARCAALESYMFRFTFAALKPLIERYMQRRNPIGLLG